MQISKAIVHSIEKQQHAVISVVKPRTAELPMSDQLTALVSDLCKLYNEKTTHAYGSFDPDTVNYPFSDQAKKYTSGNSSFVGFTTTAMGTLKKALDGAQLATGSNVFFAHYVEKNTSYLLIASLKNKAGLAFDALLNLTSHQTIDLSHLHEMARVNLDAWAAGAPRYLSFAKRRTGADGFTAYFREFIGCAEFSESKALTRLTLEALNAYCLDSALSLDERDETRKKAHQYFVDKKTDGKMVSIDELSRRLSDDEPDAFLIYVNQNSARFPITSGYEPDATVYKSLKKYYLKNKKISIAFDADLYNKEVIYNPLDGSLLIKNLPPEFIATLSAI